MTQTQATIETRVVRTLCDYTRRQSLRNAVKVQRNGYDHSPRRYWNDAMKEARAALSQLSSALDAHEYAQMRGTDASRETTLAVAQEHAPRIAALLEATNAAMSALNTSPDTNPTDPHETTQRATERELRDHLTSRTASTREAFTFNPNLKTSQTRRFWASVASAGLSKSARASRLKWAAQYLGVDEIESFNTLTSEQIGRLADAVSRGDVVGNWQMREETFAVAFNRCI